MLWKGMMVYIVFILVYVTFSIHAHLRIRKSLALNVNRKRIHIILSWMIPFLWYLFIKDFIDYKLFTMTKKIRDQRYREKYPSYHESRKGFHHIR
jgi:4-amino-4-deoxy-L-arabinose transferase-like glycosyltransferase